MPAVEIVHVRHGSSVAAIPNAEGPARLIRAGLARLLESYARVSLSEITLGVDSASNPVAEAFEVSRLVARRVATALGEGKIPIVLSGSCHTAIGSVAALEGRRRGVIWLDAHGDFNTPDTTVSGLLDGTTLATITGRCYAGLRESVEGFATIADENVLMLGVRELDPGEKRLLEGSRVMRVGTERSLRESGQILTAYGQNTDAVYLHVDLDVLDSSSGAANAYACPGGFSAGELERLLRAIAKMTAARVLAVTSYDPDSDEDGRACDAALRAIQAFIEARVSKAR